MTTDLDGNPRFVDDPATTDTGYGDPPIVDMGAYEYQVGLACPADCSGPGGMSDGIIDVHDLLLVLGQWGTADPQADLAGVYGIPDGVVDVHDLLAVIAAWGPCP